MQTQVQVTGAGPLTDCLSPFTSTLSKLGVTRYRLRRLHPLVPTTHLEIIFRLPPSSQMSDLLIHPSTNSSRNSRLSRRSSASRRILSPVAANMSDRNSFLGSIKGSIKDKLSRSPSNASQGSTRQPRHQPQPQVQPVRLSAGATSGQGISANPFSNPFSTAAPPTQVPRESHPRPCNCPDHLAQILTASLQTMSLLRHILVHPPAEPAPTHQHHHRPTPRVIQVPRRPGSLPSPSLPRRINMPS